MRHDDRSSKHNKKCSSSFPDTDREPCPRQHVDVCSASVSRVRRVYLGSGVWQQASGTNMGSGSWMLMCSHECTMHTGNSKWGRPQRPKTAPRDMLYPSCSYLTQQLWTQCPLRLEDISHSKMPTEEEFGRKKIEVEFIKTPCRHLFNSQTNFN